VKNKFYFNKSIENIYIKPSSNSEVSSQILYGEKFIIRKKIKNWVKIKTLYDNYNGFIKIDKFRNKLNSTHKIFKIRSYIYRKVKNKFIKTTDCLFFSSNISILSEEKNFFEFEKNKWIKKKDIKKIKHIEKDYLKILRLFINTKYVWGGKTYQGIDCSAILQLIFYYNNKFYPRDTKDQMKYSKINMRKNIFKKGNIIFWKGHVAICTNSKKLIHAHGPKKKVLVMPIKVTIDKIEKTAKLVVKKVSSIKY